MKSENLKLESASGFSWKKKNGVLNTQRDSSQAALQSAKTFFN